ncbi:MAG TPA: oxidoreductase [Nocardioidaceae bacterium]|nr:oxidoreductase [Nocardioidaceae bacterium]
MAATADAFAALASLEGVASAFAAARDGIDALLRDRGLRRTGPDLTAEALLRGARASAALERGGPAGDEYDETGAVRLSTALLGLLPIWRTAPLQALARMHTLVARGTVRDDDLGRPVRSAARLSDLADRLAAPTSAPGLVVAAVVHAEIAASEAFDQHNRVLARAAERLVLAERGVDSASVTVPEAGHLALAPAYAHLLEQYRGAGPEQGPRATHAWLLHCAQAYAVGAERSPLADPGSARRTR